MRRKSVDNVDPRLQRRIRAQIEDEMLAASVILEMRTAIAENNVEYARGYLDGLGLALRWNAARWEAFKQNYPEAAKRLGDTRVP
jgi:hypothetical protein